MIELSNVTKYYGPRAALSEVSLRIGSGITGLLGPNGSGKSTLIKAILGLVKVWSGQGTVIGKRWPEEIKAIRDLVGYLPEDDCYITGLQGIESVQLSARFGGLPSQEAKRRAHEVLDFCDVGQERYRNVETYSTGMRQKLKLAMAIVHDPKLLILDEPTTGLDPGQRQEFLNRTATLAREHGKVVLISTHILHDVRQICDHVVILAAGKVRVADTLESLSRPTSPGLVARFIGDSSRIGVRAKREGIEALEHPDGAWFLPGMTKQDVQRIWEWAADEQVPIERLESARTSLDQIFLDAVKETDHAHS